MDAVVYRTATRLRHHQHRVVYQVPVLTKTESASENSLIGSGRSLSVQNNYGYQDPFGPHIGAITRLRLRAGRHQQSTSTAAGWCGQTTPRAAQRGYQDSPRQPRQDRALPGFRIWREPATRPWLDVAATRLSPPPLSCHLARSRETAPPGDSGHKIRAWRAPDMRPELGKTPTCASTNADLASRTGRVPQFARSATVADGGPFRACIGNRCAPPSPSIGRARLVLP